MPSGAPESKSSGDAAAGGPAHGLEADSTASPSSGNPAPPTLQAGAAALGDVRNLGIIAHIDAGKTTLSERLLFFSGVERRMGEVHHGSTVLDWMPEERRRGISITAAATLVPWRGRRLFLIDTPGHVDFTVEVERSLRVLDGAVLVISALSGVEAQSEAVFAQARRFGVPTIIFVNQCDREGADFLGTVAEIERRLHVRAVAVHYPIGEGQGFVGLVDLLSAVAYTFPKGEARPGPIPEYVRDEALVLRAELIELLGDHDDRLLECLIEGREPELELLQSALRGAVGRGELHPVLLGSALQNAGIQPLLDGIVAYLPSPLDRGAVTALELPGGQTRELPPDPAGPLCAFVFKVQRIGKAELTFLRMYSGELRRGQRVFLPRLERELTVGELLRVHADGGEPIDVARAGEIAAWRGLEGCLTGDTLCSPECLLALERPEFSEPVLSATVEPTRSDDRTALGQALELLTREDPTLRVREDQETGQWLLSGMGELHLDIVQRRLADDFGLAVRFGEPSVAYREAVLTTARGAGLVERQLGQEALYGALEVEVLPEPGTGRCEIEWVVPPPAAQLTRVAVEQALARVAQMGPRFGFPLADARVRIVGFDTRLGRESEQASAQAAVIALREALQGISIELHEPWMSLEVYAPENLAGGVLGELFARGAKISEQVQEGHQRRIRLRLPLAGLRGFTTALRSLSEGRAIYSVSPAGFAAVPESELVQRGLVWQ
jgi:elongation factor G